MKRAAWSLLAALVAPGAVFGVEPEPGFLEAEILHPEREAFWQWEEATGDWLGVRTDLRDRGLDWFGSYTAEVWGNTTGGERTGAVYDGLLEFGLDADLEKLLGWQGATLHNSWLWLSGRSASEELVGNILEISNISGFPTLRMFELWFQQELFEDRFSIRLGQLAADSEFFISDTAELFLNGTFGWPAILSENLPGGGPGYPLAAPGIRLAFEPVEWFTFLTAAFQGNVFDEDVNRHGFRWELNGRNGFLFLNEGQVRWGEAETSSILPGTAKAGVWLLSGKSADVFSSSTESGNYGVYAILDQQIFSPGGASEPDTGLSWFGRVGFAPQDRNELTFYFDTGLAYTGLLPGREEDSLGLAFAYAGLGSRERSELRDEGLHPVAAEMVLEATYECQLTPWFSVQPDLQFVINPGGTSDLRNALVVGGRATITF